MIRTGLFRFVRHQEIEAYHQRGWMVAGDLGATHGAWSVLCWACDCPAFRVLATDPAKPRPDFQDMEVTVAGRQFGPGRQAADQLLREAHGATSGNSGRGSVTMAGRS